MVELPLKAFLVGRARWCRCRPARYGQQRDVDAGNVRGMRVAEACRNEGPPIMTVSREGSVPEDVDHQRLQIVSDLVQSEARLVFPKREAVTRHRRRDDGECVVWRSAIPRRVRQAGNELVILVERARPTVGQEQRARVGAFAVLADVMKLTRADRYLELLEQVDLRFLHAPVVRSFQ